MTLQCITHVSHTRTDFYGAVIRKRLVMARRIDFYLPKSFKPLIQNISNTCEIFRQTLKD